MNPRVNDRGQILVIVAIGLVALIAMVGLVIDGGHAWGQQRRTQNAADSVAMAGTTVIQAYLQDVSSPVTGGDVGCAVEEAANANGIELDRAEYTDFEGRLFDPTIEVPACGSGDAIPAGSQGVKATAEEEFDTFLMGIIGLPVFDVQADATAIVGTPSLICPASQGCGVLPVTFPRTVDTCDGTNHRIIGQDEWVILNPDHPSDPDILDATNLALLPLCATGPGSVGWLDLGCGNLASHITDPCNTSIPIPAWLDTQTGNPNCCESDLNAYAGSQPGVPEPEDQVLWIPIHDFTCRHDLADSAPITACDTYPEWSAAGNNLHYHIPYWLGFKLDGAFTQGNDAECNQAPGNPPAGGNGATGCLKGWFVDEQGPPGPIVPTPINPGDPVSLGVSLVR